MVVHVWWRCSRLLSLEPLLRFHDGELLPVSWRSLSVLRDLVLNFGVSEYILLRARLALLIPAQYSPQDLLGPHAHIYLDRIFGIDRFIIIVLQGNRRFNCRFLVVGLGSLCFGRGFPRLFELPRIQFLRLFVRAVSQIQTAMLPLRQVLQIFVPLVRTNLRASAPSSDSSTDRQIILIVGLRALPIVALGLQMMATSISCFLKL